MRLNRAHVMGALMTAVLAGGCGHHARRDRAAEERARWEASLPDSLEQAERQLDSVRVALEVMRGRVASLIELCRCVENPREVEKYYLPDLEGLRYPLTSTGLVGRMTASETLELVAACSGGAFDCLEVEVAGKKARTAVVPYDGALNHRQGSLTTVAFSGREADSVASLIALNPDSRPRLTYLNQGKAAGSAVLSGAELQSVVIVSQLCTARRDVLTGEKRLSMLSRRIDILKRRIDAD